ncbi:phospholipase D family protein [Uliginosibacterium sp. H3]|uniref:Phospholipase D family protein n=1 Tax=Uliginosibacterium silvisoli TaxID=3114758 RepID=A0ABU6K0K8_9RHOO|nr:phospholipase D family protein [Uliginosibacterium sp. H3]
MAIRGVQGMGSLRNIFVVVWVGMLAACAGLPPRDELPVTPQGLSPTTVDPATTRLGRAVTPDLAAHPGQAGVYALSDASEAFAARVLLAGAADRTLDVQYYIWRGDYTGYLMFEALWQAAERGVSVRLLLDDTNTAGLDDTLRALDAHPNIAVRLYNPMTMRSARLLNFVTDFSRLNHRMHNKSFTADNQATIVGGRNIGDEYFGASKSVGFEDLDVIATGPAAKDVTVSFEEYWNSASAYPAASIIGSEDSRKALLERFAETRADEGAEQYLQSLRDTKLVRELLAQTLPLRWGETRLVVDDPAKTLGQLNANEGRERLMLGRLMTAITPPQKSFELITPYFVPGKEGTESLAALVRNKVRVRVLTNSLASSDVTAVHAGYAEYRKALLQAGVELYELKRHLPPLVAAEAGGAAPEDKPKRKTLGGSSSASLHAKTFAMDGQRIFVGSFNFDQRSAWLNTEMGLVIDNAQLAGRLTDWFDKDLPARAYHVVLQDDGSLCWIEQTEKGEVRHDKEPGSGPMLRGWVKFLSILPIEWML